MGKDEKIVIGIDPGSVSGGIAIFQNGIARTWKMPETDRDIFDLLESFYFYDPTVFMEAVHSMPKQGVTSSFAFGRNYGFLRGVVTALKYPLYYVTPQKWQKALGCLTHGDKNISKAKAQQLFPQLKITHATADALLICEYGRRMLI